MQLSATKGIYMGIPGSKIADGLVWCGDDCLVSSFSRFIFNTYWNLDIELVFEFKHHEYSLVKVLGRSIQ